MEEASFIVVGRFGRVHGIHGLIRIHSFTEPRDNILQYKNWHLFINQTWQPLELSHIEVNDKHILALVKGFEDREEVKKLTNLTIGIERELLPELTQGEYYWHQLVGLKVIDSEGTTLGTILEIMATGSNDVLVIRDERGGSQAQTNKRVLIPYLPGDTVIDVNLKEQTMIVAWDWDF